MLFFQRPVLIFALLALVGCSPTLNWREVRLDTTALRLLLPCKPDKAEKAVPLGGQNTRLRMLGCEAGGATFAIAVATLGSPVGNNNAGADTAAVLAQWQSLALANMGAPAVPASATPLKIQGWQAVASASPPAPPLRLRTTGKRADGSPVVGEMVFFADGREIFQAVVYGTAISADMGDTFFGSLAFDR